MKPLALMLAALAIPIGVASAQTPSTPSPSGQAPYIALFSSGGGGGTTGGSTGGTNSTWYIDTTKNLVVMCSQGASTSGGANAAQSFTCTAQAVPTAASSGTPTPTTPTTPATGATGGAGANPM